MNKLKKEIEKVIGETTSHKAHVWQRLQQPKRKSRMPFFITTALFAIASIWLLLLQFPQEHEPETSVKNGTKDAIPYTILHSAQEKPLYVQDDFAILHATTEQDYKTMTEQLKIPFIANIDFANYDIIFALYTSDSCGLIIDQLSQFNTEFQIQLDLPMKLRDEKELYCDFIAQPHIDVIELKKQPIHQATFVEGTDEVATTFNHLTLDEIGYHFDLLLQPNKIHTIEIHDLVNNKQLEINRDVIKGEFTQLISSVTAVNGIVDMADPHYKIFVQSNDGLTQHLYLWISPASHQITIMSSRDTHRIYTIPKSEAQFILETLNEK